MWKVLSQGIHMCNMRALSLLVRKLWPRLKFFKRRSNFKVKVTRSKILVWCERSCHKECICAIWKALSLIVRKLWPRLKFLSTHHMPTRTVGLWQKLPGHLSWLAKNHSVFEIMYRYKHIYQVFGKIHWEFYCLLTYQISIPFIKRNFNTKGKLLLWPWNGNMKLWWKFKVTSEGHN